MESMSGNSGSEGVEQRKTAATNKEIVQHLYV